MRGLPVNPGVDKPSDEQIQQMAKNAAAAAVNSFASFVFSCLSSALKAIGVVNKLTVAGDRIEFTSSYQEVNIAYTQFVQRLNYIFSMNSGSCVYSYNASNGSIHVRTKSNGLPGQYAAPVYEVTFVPEMNNGHIYLKSGDNREVFDSLLKMIES